MIIKSGAIGAGGLWNVKTFGRARLVPREQRRCRRRRWNAGPDAPELCHWAMILWTRYKS